jgi:hypothetical protein
MRMPGARVKYFAPDPKHLPRIQIVIRGGSGYARRIGKGRPRFAALAARSSGIKEGDVR